MGEEGKGSRGKGKRRGDTMRGVRGAKWWER